MSRRSSRMRSRARPVDGPSWVQERSLCPFLPRAARLPCRLARRRSSSRNIVVRWGRRCSSLRPESSASCWACFSPPSSPGATRFLRASRKPRPKRGQNSSHPQRAPALRSRGRTFRGTPERTGSRGVAPLPGGRGRLDKLPCRRRPRRRRRHRRLARGNGPGSRSRAASRHNCSCGLRAGGPAITTCGFSRARGPSSKRGRGNHESRFPSGGTSAEGGWRSRAAATAGPFDPHSGRVGRVLTASRSSAASGSYAPRPSRALPRGALSARPGSRAARPTHRAKRQRPPRKPRLRRSAAASREG